MRRPFLLALVSTSALFPCMIAGGAAAQSAQATADTTLGEVVVTATRREDTVHNIPLSIQAVTSVQLEQQGLKTAQDVARTVPALRIGQTNGGAAGGATGNADVAIRGVRSTTGAPTSGIYVDDVPLQRRNTGAGGGVVFPQLFDLQRVEVLRGPQGTLYGGSSEGGTIRFITSGPSFTKYSAYLRGEATTINQGSNDYEFGAAVGGPVVQDKLAFSVAGFHRRDGGWVDHVSRFSGKAIASDTNSATHTYFHVQVAWKPTDRATLTFNHLYNLDQYHDSDNFFENFPQYSATVGPATAAKPQGTSYTYGPYNFYGPYKTAQNTNLGDQFYTSDAQLKPLLAPHKGLFNLSSLVFDYAFDKMNVKSVTAFAATHDHAIPDFSLVDVISRGGTPLEGPFNALPSNSAFVANLPYYSAVYDQFNINRVLTQELRFSSNDPDSNLNWVAGVFFNSTRLKSGATIQANLTDLTNAVLLGRSTVTPAKLVYTTPLQFNEQQIAGFGEGTYRIGEHWRVTAGIRWTRDTFNYAAYQGGQLFGLPDTPSLAASGSVTESPITPKVGLQYVVDQNTNLYVNAAKGFRPGGVNQILAPACTPGLIAAGFTNGTPPTYGSDSLWSYEGGAKIRTWGGKASINTSVYRIDWKGVQTPIAFLCGQNFTANAASVRSQGADIDATIRLFPGFTVTGAVAYTDSKYRQTVATPVVIIGAGDPIPFTPKWSGSVSAQYEFGLMGRSSYIRGDYQFQSGFVLGLGPTTSSYNPDNYNLEGNQYASARAGMRFDGFDVSVFVNNLAGSKDVLTRNGIASGPGRVSCTNGPTCTTFVKYAYGAVDTTFKPRTFGVTASYRY